VNYINPSGGNNYENNVIKVGIDGTEIDPKIYRLTAGWLGIEEQPLLDLVNTVETWKFVNMLNALVEYIETNGQSPPFQDLIGHIATFAYVMELDWLWQNVVVESTDSDGLVKRSSQHYQNSVAQYHADFVSHMEGRDHPNVLTALS